MFLSPKHHVFRDSKLMFQVLHLLQMLRAGKAKPDAWPKLPPKNDKHVEPVPRPVSRLRHGSESQSEGEDHVPIPTYQSSFGDAIKAALDTIEGSAPKKEEEGEV
jgi:hypothetical protein